MQVIEAGKKKKGRPTMKRWRVWRWIVGIAAIFVIGIIILAILGPIISGTGQITEIKLDAKYLPTAEYLLNNPLPTPQGFPASMTVEQNTVGFTGDDVEVFCVQGTVPDDTHITVEFNQQHVRGSFARGSSGFRGFDGRRLSHCIEGALETGLHLLSVEMTSYTWTENYSYTWAVEITNDGYNYIPDYLLRNLANR